MEVARSARVDAFIAGARALIGARWRHRGRKPWAVDCIGLVALAFWNSGNAFEDETGYSPEPFQDALRAGARKRWGEPLPPASAQPGDIALIRWVQREPSHIAIIGNHPNGGLTLIHANNLHGVVEHSLAGPFASIVVEVYRPWPLEQETN